MKRDMDLVRAILLELEDTPTFDHMVQLQLDDYEPAAVTYHVLLMAEGGLIEAISTGGPGRSAEWRPRRLTWAGRELLAAVRQDQRWNRLKEQMSQVGGFVFEIAKPLAISWMKRELGLP